MSESRLLTLLSLLQTPREWPGGELAERLGVSRRTIRRDIDTRADQAGAGAALPPAVPGEISGRHRMHAVRAHLPEMAGDRAGAREAYEEAARRAMSFPQQRYLHARAARLKGS